MLIRKWKFYVDAHKPIRLKRLNVYEKINNFELNMENVKIPSSVIMHYKINYNIGFIQPLKKYSAMNICQIIKVEPGVSFLEVELPATAPLSTTSSSCCKTVAR
jgi:hypothetical protein